MHKAVGFELSFGEQLGVQLFPRSPTRRNNDVNDRVKNVRYKAVEALGSIGPAAASAVPALPNALKDEDAGLRDFAAEALGCIDPNGRVCPDVSD